MADADIRESRRLVKQYSWECGERLPPTSHAYALGQLLRQDAGEPQSSASPWRKFFEPALSSEGVNNPVTKVITTEAGKLRDKWIQFQDKCSKDDQLDLSIYEPSIEGVLTMVKEIDTASQGKKKKGIGRAVGYFHKFCRTLGAHSSLLKVLPEGSEYVSIFTGTLNAVIKASANHEHLAEGLSEALCSISENVKDCTTDLDMFKTPAMLEHVADLYAHVFLFLSNFMDLVMRKRAKRLLDSFNENLNKKFEKDIKLINDKSARIRNLVEQGSRAELRDTRLTVEQLERDIRIGQEGEARHRAEMEHFSASFIRELQQERIERKEFDRRVKELINGLAGMLQENAMASIRTQRMNRASYDVTEFSQLAPSHRGTIAVSPSGDIVPPARKWMAEDVAQNSAHLEDFFHRDRVRLPCDPFGPVLSSQETLQRLITWTGDNFSQVLWVDGPSIEADDLDNPVTMLAAKFIDIASQSRVPIMSYFCELRRSERLLPGNSSEMQGTIALSSALVRQMIELSLPQFEAEVDLSEERFRLLDGTAESWEDSMAVMRTLIDLIPDKVFCVVDGLHWIDDRGTERQLRGLIQILKGVKFKTLFTTTGRAPSLLEEISVSDTLSLQNEDLLRATEGLDMIVL